MATLTSEQIYSIAPDASSLAAGKKIASQSWNEVGRSSRALWGEVSGSGKTPYFVMVDLRSIAYRCTCPSRKLPCKHALGLMFRAGGNDSSFSPEPTRVVEWLATRDDRAKKKKEKEESENLAERESAANAPTVAAAKTSAKRDARVQAGIEELQTRLDDLARLGLVSIDGKGEKYWEEAAKRLVDAQAPGLARRVAALARYSRRGDAGRADLIARLGKISLLLAAARKLPDADEALAEEVRAALGYNVAKEDVLAAGERVEGPWLSLGGTTSRSAQLFTARDWFWNNRERRFALYLQFAPGDPSFPEYYPAGVAYNAAMRFWPGTSRLRATWETPPVDEQIDAANADGQERFAPDLTRWARERLPFDAAVDFVRFFQSASDYLARAPWLETIPALLADAVVRPRIVGSRDARTLEWRVLDSEGRALPASADEETLELFRAATYDAPCAIFAEWNGRELQPVSAWRDGELVAIAIP